jgi:curved DNA-binding protein CbpA
MVFIRLPSSKSRTTLAEAASTDESTNSHTVPLIPAGESFLRWVAPPTEEELVKSSKAGNDEDSDDEGYGEIGSTGKTGRKITRDVTQVHGEATKRAKVEDEVDHYKVLGLGKWGPDSTPKQVLKAYHRAILKYHPDKQQNRPASAGRLEEDPVFLAIQKAYKVLSDQSLRRGYDSTFDFDESIPSGLEKLSEEEFFEVYGPVFKRNARFSENKPVPLLGDKDTPMEGAWGVNAFYDFWFKFESWREFSSLDEHNVSEAEDREERRWMEKKNKSARAARKKKDMQRYRTLVERARKNDPRVKAFAIKQKMEREAEKAKRKAEREAYKQSLANAAKAKEDAIIAEKEAKEQEKKDQQKAAAGQKKLLKKLRRKWNKYCEELDVDDENVSDLVEILGLEEGKFFWGGTSSYKHTLEIYFSSRNE